MKRIALSCKNPGKWFHDCKGCEYYDGCDYFQKVERKITPMQRSRLKLGLDERMKVRRRKEDERREQYFK